MKVFLLVIFYNLIMNHVVHEKKIHLLKQGGKMGFNTYVNCGHLMVAVRSTELRSVRLQVQREEHQIDEQCVPRAQK